MVEQLKTFIKDNNLSFKEGQRNTNATIICGYALFIGVEDEELVEDAIEQVFTSKIWEDTELQDEIDRVFRYAKSNNYGKWWEKPEAAKMYKF